MDKEQIKSEYEQLCKQAEQHNFNYYVLDDPTIEDDEYDRLMRRIKEIEAENPEIVSESSPTQHVGGYAINTFEKVTHEVQMGSLQDVFSKGELYEFDERVKKAVGKAVYCVEPKIDGLSVSLEYKDGCLLYTSPRKNGRRNCRIQQASSCGGIQDNNTLSCRILWIFPHRTYL